MAIISKQLNSLKTQTYRFQDKQVSVWSGKSGKKVNEICKSPVNSLLSSATTMAETVEKIIGDVNSLNNEIASLKKIDGLIADYNKKLTSFYGLSVAKRAVLNGMDRVYLHKLQELNKIRKQTVSNIKLYERNINSKTSTIL